MRSLSYPLPHSYSCEERCKKVVIRKWNSGFSVFGVNLKTSLLAILCCLFATLFFVSNIAAQSPCPNEGCTSGDLRITDVKLVQANHAELPGYCTPGQTNVNVALRVTINVTSNTRYGFVVIGNIYLNNSSTPAGTVAQCFPGTFNQGVQPPIYLDHYVNGDPIVWPCGSTIQLKDVYTAWDNQAPSANVPSICTYLNADGTISSSSCSTINPKCKYYGSNDPLTVVAPLVTGFTAVEGGCSNLKRSWTFTSTTVGGQTPYTYTWDFGDGTTLTTTSNPVTHEYTSAGSKMVSLSVEDASTPTHQVQASAPQTISVTSCCVASTDPTGAAAVTPSICLGGNTNISVSGGSLGTQASWKWYGGGCGSGTSIGTGTTINVNPTQTITYYVRAEGPCGTTQCASVQVVVNPVTVGGSVGNAQTICNGNQPSSDLVLSGNVGNVVKWQRSTDNFASNVSNISNTSVTLTASAIGALTQNTWFRAVVKSGACSEENSVAVKITVDPLSVGGSVSSPQRICNGSQPVSNLVLTGNVGSVIRWESSTSSNFSTGVSSIANTTTTLTAAAIGALTQDTWFRAVVKSGACSTANSSAVKISVDPTTVGGSTGANQIICSSNQPENNLVLSGQTGDVVMWQKSTDGFVSNSTNIANTTTTLLTSTIGALTQDTWFRAVVKSGECLSVNSGVVKITVQQPVSNNTIAASQTICSGNSPATLTGSLPSGGNGSYVYQWQSRTTGGFTNIAGATDKDYAPGSLTQTTEFRRIVTAGAACSGNTSASATVTISPESVVYAIAGSNFCASAPNTGTITLSGSYTGVSYQLKKASDNTAVGDAQIGNGAALTWTGLDAGVYYVLGTGIAPTYCTSQTANATVIVFDCSVFYTLTQGYYGGKNGKSCIGITPANTIRYLLGSTDLIIGTTKYLKIPATDQGANKLNQAMPGGSTPVGLPIGSACDITTGCFSQPTYLTKQGKINNILLSQTITLSLNARWNDGELLLFPIRSGYLTTQKMTGCGPDASIITTCGSGTVSSVLMNQNVVNYLGSNATVSNLLQLANAVLGGTALPGAPSYSEVNDAVSAINEAFDEGRRFLDYYTTKQTCEMLFPAPAMPDLNTYITATTSVTTTSVQKASVIIERTATAEVSVKAYPNPYSDKLSFVIHSKLSGMGSLEVFNMLGQKLKIVYQGYITSGEQKFELTLPSAQRSNLVYIFKIGDKQVTGKILKLGKN